MAGWLKVGFRIVKWKVIFVISSLLLCTYKTSGAFSYSDEWWSFEVDQNTGSFVLNDYLVVNCARQTGYASIAVRADWGTNQGSLSLQADDRVSLFPVIRSKENTLKASLTGRVIEVYKLMNSSDNLTVNIDSQIVRVLYTGAAKGSVVSRYFKDYCSPFSKFDFARPPTSDAVISPAIAPAAPTVVPTAPTVVPTAPINASTAPSDFTTTSTNFRTASGGRGWIASQLLSSSNFN